MKTSRTDKEITALLDEVTRSSDQGVTRFPGMSYEEGIAAVITWLWEDSQDHPYPEE